MMAKRPWKWQTIALISLLLNPLAGYLLTWQNIKRLNKQRETKLFLIIGLFFLFLIFSGSLFLSGISPFLYGLTSYIFTVVVLPFWIVFFNNPLPQFFLIVTDLLINLLFSLFCPVWFYFRFKNEILKPKNDHLIINWSLVGVALSLILVTCFSLNFNNSFTFKSSGSSVDSYPTSFPLSNKTELAKKELAASPPSYYVKILDNKVDSEPYYITKQPEIFDCQPELYDPQERNYQERVGVTVDLLSSSDDLTVYRFGCASTFSYVVEVFKDKKRTNLFTHVEKYDLDDEKKYIFLINWVKNNKDEWEREVKIINLETKQKVLLPNTECVGNGGRWEGNKLLTYGGMGKSCPGPIKICIWDRSGLMQTQLESYQDTVAGAGCYLNSDFGLLPGDNDIFYGMVISSASDEADYYPYIKCALALQDVKHQEKNKIFYFEMPNNDWIESYHCPPINLDLKDVDLSSEVIRYQTKEDEGEKEPWSSWKEATQVNPYLIEKTEPIFFKNYKITLPEDYYWFESERLKYGIGGDDVSECNYIDIHNHGIGFGRLRVANCYDNKIANEKGQIIKEYVELGMNNYLAGYDFYYSTRTYDDEDKNKVVMNEGLWAVQGCPREDLCISCSRCYGIEDEIKDFINNLDIEVAVP